MATVMPRPFSLPEYKMGQILFDAGGLSKNMTDSDLTTKIEINHEKSRKHKPRQRGRNEKAQAIFSFLANHYNTDLKSPQWAKAKRYIYHATTVTNKTKNNPLSVTQVASVVEFLDGIFISHPNSTTNSMEIITTVPRILRKNPTSYLAPTVDFLKGLYHGTMFFEAVQRNPNLLLTSGVGFNDCIGNGSINGNNGIQNRFPNEEMVDECDIENEIILVEEYLLNQHLGLSARSIAKLKRSHPSIFQLSVSTKVDPIIDFLVLSISMSSSSPSSSTSRDLMTTERLIVGKMIISNPNILNLSIDNVQAKIEFLKSCGFDSKESLAGLWKNNPGILSLSLDDNLRPTTRQLKNLLGCRYEHENRTDGNRLVNQQMFKILSLHPQLLALSAENLIAKITFFDSIDELAYAHCDGIGGEDYDKNIHQRESRSASTLAARVALSAPSVFSLSLERNIIPKVICLARLWNVQAPLTDSESYIHTLEDQYGYTNTTTLSRQLAEYPNILTLSLEGNIEPTILFYNRTGYISLDEDGSSKNYNPTTNCDDNLSSPKMKTKFHQSTYLPARYIATSLFNRLLPRWNYHVIQEAERLNKEKDSVTGTDSAINDDGNGDIDNVKMVSKPPLHVLAGATDEMFCKRMKYNHVLYAEFKKEAIPKLKFSSQFATWLKTGRPIDDI